MFTLISFQEFTTACQRKFYLAVNTIELPLFSGDYVIVRSVIGNRLALWLACFDVAIFFGSFSSVYFLDLTLTMFFESSNNPP